MESSRREVAAKMLRQYLGESLAGETVENLKTLPTEFAESMIDFVMGDIYSREGLTLRDRCLCTISALVVIGNQAQLELHLKAGKHQGLSRQETFEVLLQMAVYGGFPRSWEAVKTWKTVYGD